MKDRKTVIEALKKCKFDYGAEFECFNGGWYPWRTKDYKCPYYDPGEGCLETLMEEAAKLLEEKEPVQPEYEGDSRSIWWYVCGDCHGLIDSKDRFCRHCGREIDWNEQEKRNKEAAAGSGWERTVSAETGAERGQGDGSREGMAGKGGRAAGGGTEVSASGKAQGMSELEKAAQILGKLIGFFGTADYDEILPQLDRILESAEVYDGPCPPMPKGEKTVFINKFGHEETEMYVEEEKDEYYDCPIRCKKCRTEFMAYDRNTKKIMNYCPGCGRKLK